MPTDKYDLLEKWEIQWTTSDTTTERMATKTPLLANERANFALVNLKVKQLGQVPVLLPLFDSEHLPEEKCILTFLAYLHSRLLGASREIHAAFCLQHWWVPRFRRSRAAKRDGGARVLQKWWASTSFSRFLQRSIRRRLGHVVALQSFGRLVLAKRERAARCRAVHVLQSAARRWLHVPIQNKKNKNQEMVEQLDDMPANHYHHVAARTLQQWWRRWRQLSQTQTLWRALAFHGHRVRHAAASVLQRWYHRHLVQEYWYAIVFYVRLEKRQHDAASVLQRKWRRVRQRQAAVHALSKWWRSQRIRNTWRNVVLAAMDVERRHLWDQVRRASASRLQRWYRTCQHQYAVRAWWTQLATLVWEQHDEAATTVQRAWLSYKLKQQEDALETEQQQAAAAMAIQRWMRRGWQMWRCRQTWIQLAYDLWDQHTQATAASMIQTVWRRRHRLETWQGCVHAVMNDVKKTRAMSRIQRWYVTTKRLLDVKQTWMELTMALWEQRNQDQAATMIQRWVRHRQRQQLALAQQRHEAATTLQLWWVRAQRTWEVTAWWTSLAVQLWDQKATAQAVATASATTIQLWWRHVRAIKVEFLMAEIERHASVRLQRWWRRRCHVHRVADLWHGVVGLVRREQRHKAAATTLQSWAKTLLANRHVMQTQAKWAAWVHQVRANDAALFKAAQQQEQERLIQMEAQAKEVAAIVVQQFLRRYQQLQWWRSVVIHTQNQHAAASYIQQWWHAMTFRRDDEPSADVQVDATTNSNTPGRRQPTKLVWTVPPVVVLQKWWRGMRVRLRCAAAVTIMRHRVQAAQTSAVVATLALRQQSAGYVQEESIPLRYRLKRALAILNTSPRLHEMLQAVHTLEMCTRLSTECCVECVAHRVPRLLYKAIRKCNRSRPHLELLHQLLQVCLHLTSSRGGDTAKNTSSSVVVMDGGQDVEGVGMSLELWIDLLQMHRDSTVLFTLSARLCKRTLATLNANEWSLGEAPRRLRLLHALMSKKAKTKSTVDRVAPPPTTKQAKEHLHPQKAASMLQTLVDMCE